MIETIIVEVPNPNHPYGVKGVAEANIVPPMAAIANAIQSATGKRLTAAADVAAESAGGAGGGGGSLTLASAGEGTSPLPSGEGDRDEGSNKKRRLCR